MPLYETHDDRRRQVAVCHAYASAFCLDFVVMPQLSLWDAEFSVGARVVSITEVKHRNCSRRKYDTFKIDKAKVDGMLSEAHRRGVRCGVLVEFEDGLFKVLISPPWLGQHARVSVILRKDRTGETPDPAYEWSNTLWKHLREPLR